MAYFVAKTSIAYLNPSETIAALMTLICVASPKGGVGKTMVTAHLAEELRRAGIPRVVAVDLDPQNALRLHFGIPISHRAGFAPEIASRRLWRDTAVRGVNDVIIYPFGTLSLERQMAFERVVVTNPGVLANDLVSLAQAPDTVVIVDTAPGYSVALSALIDHADMVVTVMTAEASCVSLIAEIHSGSCYAREAQTSLPFLHQVVVNRFDPMNRISAMTMPQIIRRLGSMHLGTIFRDEHVGEAFASQKLIHHYAPFSRAALDLEAIGDRLLQTVRRLH